MKPVHRLIAVAAIAALSACSTLMTTPHSGYLSDYRALAEAPDAATASRAATKAIDPASVLIAKVVWRVEAHPHIRPEAADALTAQLPHELQQPSQGFPAAPRLGYFTPLSELRARFSRLAPAEIAVRKAAADFVVLLKPSAVVAELAQR